MPPPMDAAEIVREFRATEPNAFSQLWSSFFVRIVEVNFLNEDFPSLLDSNEGGENQHAVLQPRSSTGGKWNSMFGMFSKPTRNNQPGPPKSIAGNSFFIIFCNSTRFNKICIFLL